MKGTFVKVATILVFFTEAGSALSRAFPSKPIRLAVGFPAGATSEQFATQIRNEIARFGPDSVKTANMKAD